MMLIDEHSIFLVGGEDDEQAIFTLREAELECHLCCAFRSRQIEATASDFFEALCQVRTELAGFGLIPFCYGASLNVYPSGMARDMGQGLKAYRLTMGRHATGDDLVHIFAEGPDVIPASVETQAQFFRDWVSQPRV